jgi:hypothetical protein
VLVEDNSSNRVVVHNNKKSRMGRALPAFYSTCVKAYRRL